MIGEIFASQHKTTREMTLGDLNRIGDELALWKPPADISPIIWLTGHVCIAENGLILQLCAGESLLPRHYLKLFGRGTSTLDDYSGYPPMAEIMENMAKVHVRALEYLSGVTEEEMDQPVLADIGVPFIKKRGDSMIQCQRHEMYHHAQIRIIRKLFMKEEAT